MKKRQDDDSSLTRNDNAGTEVANHRKGLATAAIAGLIAITSFVAPPQAQASAVAQKLAMLRGSANELKTNVTHAILRSNMVNLVADSAGHTEHTDNTATHTDHTENTTGDPIQE